MNLVVNVGPIHATLTKNIQNLRQLSCVYYTKNISFGKQPNSGKKTENKGNLSIANVIALFICGTQISFTKIPFTTKTEKEIYLYFFK